MLIARAPLRISFLGGGTDLPAYYEQYGGLVVSTTIDKYVYALVSANGDGVQITSADYQTFYRQENGAQLTWLGDLALPRAVLHEFGGPGGVSIFLASEVPPGTGLGSSSAVAVALVRGVAAQLGRSLSQREVAELACQIELTKLRAPIGKQDQFAAAFGGLNAIEFARDGVSVEPVAAAPDTVERLQSRLLLFFTGTARDSAAILREQRRASERGAGPTIEALHGIKAAAHRCRRCLEEGDVDGVGLLLAEGWRLKRRVAAGITNPRIDELYEAAIAHGALGGKLTGAGGGGFLLVYCHEAHQPAVTRALEERGARRMDFRFERRGAAVASVAWDETGGQPPPGRAAALSTSPDVSGVSGDTPDPASRGFAPAGHPRGFWQHA